MLSKPSIAPFGVEQIRIEEELTARCSQRGNAGTLALSGVPKIYQLNSCDPLLTAFPP